MWVLQILSNRLLRKATKKLVFQRAVFLQQNGKLLKTETSKAASLNVVTFKAQPCLSVILAALHM